MNGRKAMRSADFTGSILLPFVIISAFSAKLPI
jgi:hypothetical protein